MYRWCFYHFLVRCSLTAVQIAVVWRWRAWVRSERTKIRI